ncbi:spore cortex biosynthesis protein YabQ [Paenibacillus sp. J31TS4]|uniref:spore cortex biosynthesis protein YabQ n=1 Tax=Paenibacillus sp. J31TS4 TaxID=2807195 RepID=UPI0020C09DD4|nr:spore cortex biosynthesis protein YabQ [Paenibacillus sp. J31TS4]
MQFLTMGMMFVSGCSLGILFDAYRVLTGQLRVPRWLLPVFDVAYWTAATLLVFRALYYSNQGQLRLFVFIGLLAGGTFYWAFLREGTVRTVLWLIRAVRWLIRVFLRLVDMLVITPLRLLYKLVVALIGIVLAIGMFVLRIMLQLMRPFEFLLLRPLKALVRRIRWPKWIAGGTGRLRTLWSRWFGKR